MKKIIKNILYVLIFVSVFLFLAYGINACNYSQKGKSVTEEMLYGQIYSRYDVTLAIDNDFAIFLSPENKLIGKYAYKEGLLNLYLDEQKTSYEQFTIINESIIYYSKMNIFLVN